MIKPGVETYLGDGLYVSHDGYQICLRASEQRVYVEPPVWCTLLAWVKELQTPLYPVGVENRS